MDAGFLLAGLDAWRYLFGRRLLLCGMRIDTNARVMDSDGGTIPGLFATGELVGGIFWFNYPGGTGLMNGAVFGKIAGTTAGQRAKQSP